MHVAFAVASFELFFCTVYSLKLESNIVALSLTVLDIKRVENVFFQSMYIFSVILHAIDKQDI